MMQDALKMKPFNLEAAKNGAPILRRDGMPMKFVAHIPEAIPEHRVIVLSTVLPAGSIFSYREDGCNIDGTPNLFMAPVKKKVYMIINAKLLGGGQASWMYTTVHNTHDEAERVLSTLDNEHLQVIETEIEV